MTLWLILPALAALAVSVWLSYASAERQATVLTDRLLASSARMIAAQVGYGGGVYSVSIPPAALELFAPDSHDQIAYVVFDPNGLLIAGHPGFEPPSDASKFEPRFFQTVFRGRPVRAVVLRRPVITPDGSRSVSVVVGETLNVHNRLLRKFWLHTFFEEAALVFAATVTIWVGIDRELRPLVRLRQAVLDRRVDRLEPFDPSSVPSELRPLVMALNSDVKWLGQLRRQRRFLESAAHQLRTPLAIMKTQVGYARRTGTPEEISATLRQIDESLTSMGRLTSQLLALGGLSTSRRRSSSSWWIWSRWRATRWRRLHQEGWITVSSSSSILGQCVQ